MRTLRLRKALEDLKDRGALKSLGALNALRTLRILKALNAASSVALTPSTPGLTRRRQPSMYHETASMEIRKNHVKREYKGGAGLRHEYGKAQGFWP